MLLLTSGCSRWMRYNLEGALNNISEEKVTILDITNDYIVYFDKEGVFYKAYYADDGTIYKKIER